jgi:hypothetical protein
MRKIQMIIMIGLIVLFGNAADGHNSYTGGYSGAPGRSTCASSCHASSTGTVVVVGFPSLYVSGRTYTITVKHSSGSKIVNFNATTRIGSTSTVAGTFAAVSNCALYSGTDGGVYANPHLIDSAVFKWTAPAQGTGTIYLYVAGMQGTSTSSSSGQTTKISNSSSEIVAGVGEMNAVIKSYVLAANYPNPFNPTTSIQYQLPQESFVRLSIVNMIGQEVNTLVNSIEQTGSRTVQYDASGLPSGIYYYRLDATSTSDPSKRFSQTRKMLLVK